MSKALSGERQHVIDAAQKYKADAEFLWRSLLKPYCNTLAQSDHAFIVALCLEHKCDAMFADLASNLWMLERHELNEVEFADFEAKLIASATVFFTAARQTFSDLQKHFKQSPPAVYERMPDASNQLRGIIDFIDGKLGNASELRQIRANRLKPVESPGGFQAISIAQAQFMAARAANTRQALSGKQPLGAVTLHAAMRAAKGNRFAIKAAGAAPIILKALHPTEAPASAPATGASTTPTEAEKLARDRRRHEATGEVTTRLLCDIHGIERGALGQFLRKIYDTKDANGVRFISTTWPEKFTPRDREKVKGRLDAGAVKRRPKRPDK